MIQKDTRYYRYQYCINCGNTEKEEITDKNVIEILLQHINFNFYDNNKELHVRKVVALCEDCASKLEINIEEFEKFRLDADIYLGDIYIKDVQLLVELYKKGVSPEVIKEKTKGIDCEEITAKLKEILEGEEK